jgi:hypothetical protein
MSEEFELLIDDLIEAEKDVERSDGGIQFHHLQDVLRDARNALATRT